jgi:hypothetical protein
MPFVSRAAVAGAVGLTVLAALAVSGLADGPASAKAKKCSTGGVTLAASEQSRVFSKAKSEDDPVYACRYKNGKKVKLGTYRNCSDFLSVSLFRLAGPYFAFESESCGLVAREGSVKLVDLRTGQTKFSKTATPISSTAGEPDYGVRSLVLKPSGSLAWIGRFQDTSGPPGTTYYVQTKTATLDFGATIAGDSLALAGSTLYWLNGGTPFTATLS